MSVEHRRADVLVAKQLLDGPDVGAALEQMRRAGMPERVTAHVLNQVGFPTRFLDGEMGRKGIDLGFAISAGCRTLWKKMNRLTQWR